MPIAAIVVAAGRGSRMRSDVPKAFVQLRGRALFLYAVETILKVRDLCQLIVVTGAEYQTQARQLLSDCAPAALTKIVAGGVERQDSVAAGLQAVQESAQWVMIHDAARPFVSLTCMQTCIDAAVAHGGAIVALPCHDTVKEVVDEAIVQTVDRSRLWLAQTPQVFRSDWLRDAFARAAAENVLATDDAALLERYGYPVRVVLGEATNRKLTTPEDLNWAELYLESRRAG